jgi:hypothetical protein
MSSTYSKSVVARQAVYIADSSIFWYSTISDRFSLSLRTSSGGDYISHIAKSLRNKHYNALVRWTVIVIDCKIFRVFGHKSDPLCKVNSFSGS